MKHIKKTISKQRSSAMIRQFPIAAIMVCAGFSASAAQAQENPWYVTASVGLTTLGDQDLQYRDGVTASTDAREYDASLNSGGTLGYQFSDQWRVEGELMYRRNEQANAVSLDGLGDFDDGDFASLSLAVSAIYDFDLFASPDWRGYVGGGVAFIQEIDIDLEQASEEISFETSDIGIQLQAGARHQINDRWFADAGVRYLMASDVEMEQPDDTSRLLTSDYSPLSFSVGIGFKF
ncbi:MAG: outer membrane protein [Woeseiaceae bacterium]